MIYGYAWVSILGQDLETQIIALTNQSYGKIYTKKILEQKLNENNFSSY
ncbi:recombinase family protein [Enterococcus sp. LJL120]